MSEAPQLSVVVPVHNEEDNVAPLVAEIVAPTTKALASSGPTPGISRPSSVSRAITRMRRSFSRICSFTMRS